MQFRDVNHSGKGDINIHENNISVGKPLTQCTNEELFNEREFRIERLEVESKKRKSQKRPLLIFCFMVFVVGAIFGIYKTNNISDITTWTYAMPGAILSLFQLRDYGTLSKYEIKHLQALEEIKDILRERGVE